MKLKTIFSNIKKKLFSRPKPTELGKYGLLFSTFEHYGNATDEEVEKLREFVENAEWPER